MATRLPNLFLATLLVGAVAVACGGQPQATRTAATVAPSASATTSPAAEPSLSSAAVQTAAFPPAIATETAPTSVAPSPIASPTPAPPSPTPTQARPAATSAQITPTRVTAATVDVRREFLAEMASGQRAGVEIGPDGLVLTRGPDGRYMSQGELVSAIYRPPVTFNDLVLSWNANAPVGTGITFYARVQAGGAWSGWYAMGTWRDGRGASIRGQNDAWGAVEVDTLVLRQQAEAWQYRAVFTTGQNDRTPLLRSVSIAVADRSRPPSGPPVALPGGWARDLPVPVESQAIQDPAVAWEICSPTSLYMILRFWGVDTTLPAVYNGVRDGNGIFGNWPLNAAYAAERGLDAYVARMYSLDQVRAEIAAGRPVAVSIRYQAGQLPGAPLNSTSGHLIVVRGFTERGEVIVNDPAAPGRESVRRVLRAADLERVWLASGGVAYVLRPGT